VTPVAAPPHSSPGRAAADTLVINSGMRVVANIWRRRTCPLHQISLSNVHQALTASLSLLVIGWLVASAGRILGELGR